MNRKTLWLAAAAAVIVAVVAVRGGRRLPPAAVGRPAPPFELSDLGGQAVSLSSYKGKVVLLSFWATWCDACRAEFPALGRLYERHRGEDFVLLAPSVDEGGRKDVLPFVAGAQIPFPILLCDQSTAWVYGVHALPTAFLIDRSGTVVRKYEGLTSPHEMENDILELLDRRPS